MRKLALALCLLTTFETTATAEVIKVASWNIEHLRDGDGEGPNERRAANFYLLGEYVKRINADVFALQEIENAEALARVFDPKLYRFFLSTRNNTQRTAFVVRRGIQVARHPDVTALNTSGSLRHGVDIEITIGTNTIRLLSVHLKSGCFDGALAGSMSTNCQRLASQIPHLENWIDARAAANTPLVVMGDFNRRFDAAGDQFWPMIDDGAPAGLNLSRITQGRTSGCWGGEFPMYIDHIVYDQSVANWVVPGSFQQFIYSESADMKEELSDHCAIAVTLDIP